jgi:general secretion pathway protein F
MSSIPDPPSQPGDENVPRVMPAELPGSKHGQLSAEELIALNEEIAGMARAGLPLDQGLAALAREMGRGRLKDVTRQLAADLSAGYPLPEALKRQDGRLPPYYAALLSAGVRSGRIGDVLGTLTLYARSLGDFRSSIITAMIYPTVILVLGLAMALFVALTVIPSVADLFDKLHLKLPLLTRGLLFIGENWVYTLATPAALVVAVPVLCRLVLRRSYVGRMWWARFVYAVPVVGTLIRSARLAAFTDLLGILVDQSIPLPEALQLAARACSDPLLAEGAVQVEKDLAQGMPLGEALRKDRLVPDLVVWMTRFGERQGTLGSTLHHLAQLYRRQAEVRAALLRTVVPPILILGIAGVMVVLFVIGLVSPMFGVLDGLSKGIW